MSQIKITSEGDTIDVNIEASPAELMAMFTALCQAMKEGFGYNETSLEHLIKLNNEFVNKKKEE